MSVEKNVRPLTFADFCGQEKAKKMLEIYIKASHLKGECLDHVLISGPSSYGKTTLANIIANESGQHIRTFSAPAIKKVSDLTEILASVEANDIIFIDEIHALNRKVQEQLYFAMEQFVVDVEGELGQERIDLPHFTLIGATTDLGGLEEPCRNRFPITIHLTPYSKSDMTDIVRNICRTMGIEIEEEAVCMIAGSCRNVPRLANSYVRRVYDVALVLNDGNINVESVEYTFDLLDINQYGLNYNDMKYLSLLGSSAKPMGLATIANGLGIDSKSIESVIEPYLLQQDYIAKTPRGRFVTNKGRQIVNSLQTNDLFLCYNITIREKGKYL